jgi:3-deoxy-7-phosphoheptulonate synthase
MMLESNIVEGAQKIQADRSKLVYGQSVTDACIGWDDTIAAIREAAEALRELAKAESPRQIVRSKAG